MKIEVGTMDKNNKWNFLCLIIDNTNVNLEIDGKTRNFNLTLSKEDVEDMKLCMGRFASAMSELSKGKMSATYDVFELANSITSMSYDKDNGYYVSPYDIKDILDYYIAEGKYDHIFIAFRTGDINAKNEIPVNDWIGLRRNGI